MAQRLWGLDGGRRRENCIGQRESSLSAVSLASYSGSLEEPALDEV